MFLTSAAVAQQGSGGTVSKGGSYQGGGYDSTPYIPQGKTAEYIIETRAFLSVTPDPIGVGQDLLINVWTIFAPGEGKYMNDFKVIITDPDGITQTVDLLSYPDDGTSWFNYKPNKVGDYTFQFFFGGAYFPEGYYAGGAWSATRTRAFATAIYSPSVFCELAESPITTVTVQKDFVLPWMLTLPDNAYWTRPVQPNMRDSWEMLGSYPWSSSNIVGVTNNAWHDNYYGPFIPAVNTPHIVWSRTQSLAGIIGGEAGQTALLSSPGTPSVVYMGRAYQSRVEVINGVPTTCAVSYDIRTGEIYYAIPGGITPTHISYNYPSNPTSPVTVELSAISGGVLYKINPNTGLLTNITLPTFSGNGSNYELFFRDGYYYSFQGVKTNTENPATNVTVTDSYEGFLIKWNSLGTSNNFNSRIESNTSVTLPMSYRTAYQTSTNGNVLGGIDYESMIMVQQHRFLYGGFYGYSIVAYDMNDGGKLLWNFTSKPTEMSSAFRPTNVWIRDGVYVAQMELGVIKAWNLKTGEELWETHTDADYPWGSFWLYDEAAYGDLLYSIGYTGVWALNQHTGEVVWKWQDKAAPFETPYTSNDDAIYAISSARVIGGLLYVTDGIHTVDQPVQRGQGMICLNATTGEFLWKLSGTRMQAGAAAEGYLTAASNYDGTMYVLGKGESKTTISGPQTAVVKGGGIVLTGKVLDQSPASLSKTAGGIACVADASMALWMDYNYLQMPIDGFYGNETVMGVPVSLIAINEETWEYTYIGEAYTDSNGTFSYLWTPKETGKYTVTAIFDGTNAYGSSSDSTAVGVVESSSDSNQPNFGLYIAISTIVMVLVVLLVGFLLLRKK
ncbi:MAG: PQQ-like beta-propeller repeat protein [Nitrososphaerota archaeon]|nr:PQQ-like beta-propeller repeat protein [Nitrososphaerota archaeon]